MLEQRFMEVVPDQLRSIASSLKTIAEQKQAAEPQCVWVFTADQVWDGCIENLVVNTFATEEAAKKFLYDFVHDGGEESIEASVKERNWVVDNDEPGLDRVFEDGYYIHGHVECMVTKSEIEK